MMTIRATRFNLLKNYSLIFSTRNPRATAVILAALMLCVLAQTACRDVGDGRPTVVYLVRHAEKAQASDNNPPLSEAGARRAEALARTLGVAGVSAIYATQFRRTADTAAPLAARAGVAVTTLEVNHDDTQAYVDQLARDIKIKHRGETIVVVSHSNTLPLIVERLGAKSIPAI